MSEISLLSKSVEFKAAVGECHRCTYLKKVSVTLLDEFPKAFPMSLFLFPSTPTSGIKFLNGKRMPLGWQVVAVHSCSLQPCVPRRCQHLPTALSEILDPYLTTSPVPGFSIGWFQKAFCSRWWCLKCLQHSIWSWVFPSGYYFAFKLLLYVHWSCAEHQNNVNSMGQIF